MQYRPRLKIYKGSNNKNVFNPETFEATSYNWWVYVAKIKGVIVFNDYRYSVTTNQHQWEMKSFLKETMKVNMKKVVFVDQRESLSSGLFLDLHYERMALAEVRLKAPNRKDDFYKDQKNIIETAKKDIAILKRLGAKAKQTLASHRLEAKESEAKRLETQREKSKEARAKRLTVLNQFKDAYNSTQAVEV